MNQLEESRPSYDDVAACLGGTISLVTPAELQGLLLGTFCALGTDVDGEVVLQSCMGESQPLSASQQQVLMQLISVCKADLLEFNFSLALLLPDTDDVYEQASEFILWCQGFLTGLANANVQAMHDSDAIDALKRITEASQIDLNELEVSEDDEAYLADITEYVRLAVLTIYAELKKGHHRGSNNTTIYH